MPKQDLKKQQALELLKVHYGFSEFRPGQEKAIDSILSQKNTVVIMPTGGGKSLIYQLPALVLDGVAIVISPLIALMKDQVDGLTAIGIPATFINSSLSMQEVYNRLQEIKEGTYKLLYIAPERFYSQEFLNILKNTKVSFFAIDEAHCISQWGHDFRPSYTRLKYVIKSLDNPPVIALTATATEEVKEDIIKQLDLVQPKLIITGFARPNLHFGVTQASDSEKIDLIIETINKNPGTGIVYAGTRSKVDEITNSLTEQGVNALAYHAGMDIEDRKQTQEKFLADKAKIIVATNAFGLGINKKNIRFVIHHDMPGTIEAYYQEAGRAGRDGKNSLCLMLYHPKDRYLHDFFIKGDNPPPEIILEIYEILKNYESDTVLITYAELSSMLSQKIPDMAVGTSLKILEKEACISRPHEKTANAYLKFKAEPDKILDALGKRAKKQIEIFNKINEKYGQELQKGLNFNLDEISEELDFKKDSLKRMAKNLIEKDLIEYNPPFKGTEIKILKRIASDELNINFQALEGKLAKAYEKLDEIENYVYHEGCRQKFILKYFNDSNIYDCKKCDNCLADDGYVRKHERPEYLCKI